MEQKLRKNFAFISYNHKDVKWAKWLRRKLEWYRLPSQISNPFERSRFIRPVFRDRDELSSGFLNDEIKSHLEASRFLIVICSPNSASSMWVSEEVQYFIDLGRIEYIIPFIVEGEPLNYFGLDVEKPLQGECFPFALRLWNLQNREKELLGISIYDDEKKNKGKAFVRLVSRMIGVSFDVLWKRHLRDIRLRIELMITAIIFSLFMSYWFVAPIRIKVSLHSVLTSLPDMDKGVLIVNGNEYSMNTTDTIITTSYLPGYLRLHTIPISFRANRYYCDLDTLITLNAGLEQNIELNLVRDNTFATYSGYVYEEVKEKISPLPYVNVQVEDRHTLTDSAGYFSITFPIIEQSESKKIMLSKESYISIERINEYPSIYLKYILHKKDK